jgi:hypothetical protein
MSATAIRVRSAALSRVAATTTPVALVLALVAGSALFAGDSEASRSLPNPFFAMDTGTQDAQHQTPESPAKIPELLEQARSCLFFVSIKGADHAGDWDRLIQPLGQGEFDVLPVLKKLKEIGFTGPIGLQHYGIEGDARANLKRSMDGWKRLSAQAAR